MGRLASRSVDHPTELAGGDVCVDGDVDGDVRGWLDGRRSGSRRTVLVLAALFYAAGTFGSNIAPAWIDERPEVVLALSSRNRNLLGSVPFVNPLAYSLIGFVRVFTVAVVLYLVGRWFGTRALGWMEGQLGELPAIYRWSCTAMDRAGWALVLLMPGSNLVCLLAGQRRMPLRRFLVMLALGVVAKLGFLWIGGRIFDSQIRACLRFIDGYQWWLVGGLFALTFVQVGFRARRPGPNLLERIEHPDAAALPGPPPPGRAAGVVEGDVAGDQADRASLTVEP